MNILAKNRRANYDYELLDRYEAGLVLTGQEVKSIKTGHISLSGSFVTRKGQELFLTNANIPPYERFVEVKNGKKRSLTKNAFPGYVPIEVGIYVHYRNVKEEVEGFLLIVKWGIRQTSARFRLKSPVTMSPPSASHRGRLVIHGALPQARNASSITSRKV